jgi:hypothetical protein
MLSIGNQVRVTTKSNIASNYPPTNNVGIIEDIFRMPYSNIRPIIVDYIFVKFAPTIYSQYLMRGSILLSKTQMLVINDIEYDRTYSNVIDRLSVFDYANRFDIHLNKRYIRGDQITSILIWQEAYNIEKIESI